MTGTLELFVCVSVLLLSPCARGAPRERVYYIGIIEDFWDYAPSGKNLINGKEIADDEVSSIYLEQGPNRIGRMYKKAMFRQYTDASHTLQAQRPEWLGYLGPVIMAEVDEVIVVHLRNMASRNYSIHPHGVFYTKENEGALYPDRTSGRMKHDDSVPPGGDYTYRWEVRPEFGPTQNDANCLTWAYHSHVAAPMDIASGLVGALLTCKRGVLKEQVESQSMELGRNDVDQSFILMFNVVDESSSWYFEDNIKNFCSEPDTVDRSDGDFEESNLMHAINGYMFGNMPDMTLCQHRPVSWHLFGMGGEADLHSAYFHGNTVLERGHRTDVLSLFAATFITAQMVPLSLGRWPLSCQVNDHLMAGMQTSYTVKGCGDAGDSSQPTGVVRQYYVAAEEVTWDYGPSGLDNINMINLTNSQSPSELYFGRTAGRIGGRYLKAVFRAYTDSTFTSRKPSDKHMGILGPVLRGELGDTISVTFRNKASRNYGIQPHGLHMDKLGSDGLGGAGAEVGPGETFVYAWQLLEGPSPSDPACIPYLYYSGTDPIKDTSSGLVGPLLVCKQGSLGSSGVQKDVDKEFFLLYSVMDENESWYIDKNTETYATLQSPLTEQEEDAEAITESNRMHAVNGLVYGNLGGLELCQGEQVVWYIFGLGTEGDIHGVHFEGNNFQRQSTTRDTANVFPHTTATLTMQPQALGIFEVTCRVTTHYSAGMRHQYQVGRCPGQNVTASAPWKATRVVPYFISAEETEWDYFPDSTWELENHPVNSPSHMYVGKAPDRIGPRFKKVVYREYTDETFSTPREQPQHLGIMGPLIKAEVGEQVLVMFKNKASRPYSIHAQGIQRSSRFPGANPVQPGFITTFEWDFPESSGPGPSDPNCVTYAYFSPVDFVKMDGTHRADVLDLFPGTFQTVEMVVDNPGTWLLHCHLSEHIRMGMETTYTIQDVLRPTDGLGPKESTAVQTKGSGVLVSLCLLLMRWIPTWTQNP
ncbi:ferroxidase HEPHL1 isoform X2 [Gadus macrocephalus]|uniref:ferroxidase HEPHL1 isoform X2 n=1 Tax=Gadus macrocephalus TaxID=80720 RepID=UPI0028CB9B8A|nr:ferroxidase HEPHL1 isoform X2 [Gadus macrocephalus]